VEVFFHYLPRNAKVPRNASANRRQIIYNEGLIVILWPLRGLKSENFRTCTSLAYASRRERLFHRSDDLEAGACCRDGPADIVICVGCGDE
jgi:hypothetical protein